MGRIITFVFRFLPETKGLSVEDIVQEFKQETKKSGAGPIAPGIMDRWHRLRSAAGGAE